ncbi:MAG TPA: glycosyltransferase [Bacteroidales bacterium]
MKILFFIESLRLGGKERRLVELLRYLSLKNQFELSLVLTRNEIDYQEVYDLGIKIQIIERKYFKKDPKLFFSFYKIAKVFKPDIIHVWGNMVAFYAIPTKLLLRLPLINSQITDAFDVVYRGILSHKFTFQYSDLIIANSMAGLKTYGSPPNKSKVIYNGFDFDRIKKLKPSIEIRKMFNIETSFIVGMAASFSALKDYKTYIQAANLLLSEGADCTFLCMGKGDDSTYQELVLPERKNNVKFLGLQSDVESVMNCCDVGVLSTYTEGFPNSVMEFMALGKPVVATAGGGTEELVLDNETGYLVKVKSPSELAEKIKFLLNNPETAQKMGEKGKERIQSNFTLSLMAEKFIKVYNEFSRN